MAPSSPIFVNVFADQACTMAPDVNQTYTKLYVKVTGDVGPNKSFTTGTDVKYSHDLRFYTPDTTIGRTYYRIMLYNRFDSGEITTELHDGSVVELSATEGLLIKAYFRLTFTNGQPGMSDITFSKDSAGYLPLKYGNEYNQIYAHVKRPIWVYKDMTDNRALITTDGVTTNGTILYTNGDTFIRMYSTGEKHFAGYIPPEFDESGKYVIIKPQTILMTINGTSKTLQWLNHESSKFIVDANIYKLLNS